MSEDDSMKNEWTRSDLPEKDWLHQKFLAGPSPAVEDGFEDLAVALIAHLNEYHPKPEPDKWRAEWVAVSEDLKAASRQSDLAHEQWQKWEGQARRAESGRNAAVASAEQLDKKLAKVMSDYQDLEDEREEIADQFATFRAEIVAEAVKARESAVTRADIEEQLRIAYESGNHPIERIRIATDAMCDLFGIEAEPTVDPIEEKAIAAFKVAWHEADMHGDEGNRTRRGIRAARKVIEGAGDE